MTAGQPEEVDASAVSGGKRKRARHGITVSIIDRMQRNMVQVETGRTFFPEMQVKIAFVPEE